jgi:hypothetical protein
MNGLPLAALLLFTQVKKLGADFGELLSKSPDNGTVYEKQQWIAKMEDLKDRIIEKADELHQRWPDHFPPVPEKFKEPTPGIEKVTLAVPNPVMTATDQYGNRTPLETLAN